MKDVATVLKALGGVTAASIALRLPLGTVSAWKTRNSIPIDYWDRIIAVAKRRGNGEVSLDALAGIAKAAARQRRRSRGRARGRSRARVAA
jgi:hypothetical protein